MHCHPARAKGLGLQVDGWNTGERCGEHKMLRASAGKPHIVTLKVRRVSGLVAQGQIVGRSALVALTGIERVAQTVAEEIEGKHGQHDRDTGRDRDMRRVPQERSPGREHPAP